MTSLRVSRHDRRRPATFAVMLACVIVAAQAATIHRIYPARVGENGGSTLVVHGTGFSRGGVEGATTVFVGAQECKQDLYHFNDGQIICEVPPKGLGSSTVTVKVSITSVSKAEFAKCSSCSLSYRSDRTPVVSAVTAGAAPYEPIRVEGNLFGRDVEQYDIKFGGRDCDVSSKLNDPDTSVTDGRDVYVPRGCVLLASSFSHVHPSASLCVSGFATLLEIGLLEFSTLQLSLTPRPVPATMAMVWRISDPARSA